MRCIAYRPIYLDSIFERGVVGENPTKVSGFCSMAVTIDVRLKSRQAYRTAFLCTGSILVTLRSA